MVYMMSQINILFKVNDIRQECFYFIFIFDFNYLGLQFLGICIKLEIFMSGVFKNLKIGLIYIVVDKFDSYEIKFVLFFKFF